MAPTSKLSTTRKICSLLTSAERRSAVALLGLMFVGMGLAKRVKAKILQASTSEVSGDPQVHPQTEDYWGHVNPVGCDPITMKVSAGPKRCFSITTANTNYVLRLRVYSIFQYLWPAYAPQ